MKSLHLLSRFLLILFPLFLAAGSLAQQQGAKEFEPRVGQQGKDVVWVPTPQVLVDKMLEMAKVTPQDYVIDLGSGDGRTVISAAKLGARALGVEYNPDMVALSKKNAAAAGVSDRAQFIEADLFETDLSKATVITMFLLPDINLRLRPKILELKPGTRIVSNTFTMQEWEADQTANVDENCTSWCTALLWIVPAKMQGTWRFSQGAELQVSQEFQMITGTLTVNGTSVAIRDGRIRGEEVSFSANGARYTGRISGNTINGTVVSGDTNSKWSATRVVN